MAIRIGEQPDSCLYSNKIGIQTWSICASPSLLAQFTSEKIKQFTGLLLIDKCIESKSICWKGLEESNYVSARCDDFHAQLMLAVQNIGFCCLPNWVTFSAIANGQLVKVMDDPFLRRDVIYALRPFQKTSAKIALFIKAVKTSLANIARN